ncbi:MAG: CHAD domain-containing protein [Deltaproteobacteria bacterium]|nr:CHAD domain-containing protein [Deltaproteobacteria bacterium]
MARPTAVDGLTEDTPLGEAAARLTLARLHDVRRYQQAVLSRRGAADVHDMRVATRRLRAALRLLARGDAAEARAERLGRRVKRLQDALGEVRDLHVRAELVAALRAELGPAAPAHALQALLAEARARLPDREQGLVSALGRWEMRTVPQLMAELEGLAHGGRLGGGRLVRRLGVELERVLRRARVALRTLDEAPAHALRIAAKRLRYQLELVDGVVGGAPVLLAELVPLQELLGQLHDRDVLIGALEALAEQSVGEVKRDALTTLAALADRRAEQAAHVAGEIERLLESDLPRKLWLAAAPTLDAGGAGAGALS